MSTVPHRAVTGKIRVCAWRNEQKFTCCLVSSVALAFVHDGVGCGGARCVDAKLCAHVCVVLRAAPDFCLLYTFLSSTVPYRMVSRTAASPKAGCKTCAVLILALLFLLQRVVRGSLARATFAWSAPYGAVR